MTFLDDETKKAFVQANTILAVIVQHFEWECAKFHGQVECASANFEAAGLIVKDIHTDHLIEACNITNSRFKRRDGQNSCYLESVPHKLVVCLGTSKHDLKELL